MEGEDLDRRSNKASKKSYEEKWGRVGHKSGVSGDYSKPPEIEEQIIQLDDLDDPPPNFRYNFLCGRKPEMPDGVALMRFHFWGINHHSPRTGNDRGAAFRKLLYNQDPRHRLKTEAEFRDVTRDTGPRLLKPEILKRLNKAPISRHYPNVPEGEEAWEQQRLLPVVKTLAEDSSPDWNSETEIPCPKEEPPNLKTIREGVERMLIRLRYKDLELHPSAGGIQQDRCSSTVPDGGRYSYVQPTDKVHLLSDVEHDYKIQTDGTEFTQWGKGPAALKTDRGLRAAGDCIITAGRFLGIGFTNIDLSEETKEDNVRQLFASLVKTDWNKTLHTGTNLQEKRAGFHRVISNVHGFYQLLKRSTLLRKQFHFTEQIVERCGSHEIVNEEETLSFLSTSDQFQRDQSDAVSIEELLQKSLHPPPPIRRPCSATDCENYVHSFYSRWNMPLRLAFCPPLGIAPTNHTSDNIHFEVLDKNGEEEHVLYRWLGGIYCDRKETNDPNSKYRVYWTDSGLGEKKDTIRMYDPFLLDGRIIGDIKPAPDGSLIPAKWWPPVLFYERVLNPDSMDIVVASGVLGDIGYAVQNEIVITQHHEPWASRRPALASTNGDAVQNYVEQGQIGEAEIGGIEFDKEFARFTNIQNQRYERETAPSPSLYSNDGRFIGQIHDLTPENPISQQSIPDSTLANYPNVLRIVELDGYDNIPDFNGNARDGLQSGTFEAGVSSSDGQPNNYPFLEALFTDDVNRMEEDLRLISESEADVQTSSAIPSGAGETNNTGAIGQNVRHYNEQNNVTVAPQDLGRDQFQAHVQGMESNVNIVPQGQGFQTIMRHRPFQGGDFLVPSIEIDFQETAAFNMKGTFPASSFYNRAQYESSVLPPGRNENQHQHLGSSFPSSGFSENITSPSGKSFPTLAPSPDVYPHLAIMPYPRAPSSAAMLPAGLAVVPKKRKSSISNLQQYGQAFQPKKANLGDCGQ